MSGIQSRRLFGAVKPRSATPTIVAAVRPIAIVRPTAVASRLSLDVQKTKLTTTGGGPTCCSSDGTSGRPSDTRPPVAAKNPPLTKAMAAFGATSSVDPMLAVASSARTASTCIRVAPSRSRRNSPEVQVVATDRSVVRSTPGRRSESTSPSPRNAVFIRLKIDVAMPSPSDRPAIVKRRVAGCRENSRAACFKSSRTSPSRAREARGLCLGATGARRIQRLATS